MTSYTYFIDDQEPDTIDQFQNEFLKQFPEGVVTVASIDDLSPKDTKYWEYREQ